jgi:hypothetical protein
VLLPLVPELPHADANRLRATRRTITEMQTDRREVEKLSLVVPDIGAPSFSRHTYRQQSTSGHSTVLRRVLS